jgi:D-threo-aldose 1-dehydrogenase
MTASLEPRALGGTGLVVTPVCVGTSPMSMPEQYGYRVDPARAVAMVVAALDSPIRFVDTSNGYGNGQSERVVGEGIRAYGGLPKDYLLATKVDPDPLTGDFSGDRVRRSVDESLERLGVDRLELLHFHDPERIPFVDAMAPRGPVEALVRLRDEGVVDHLGVAGGPIDVLHRYVATDVFEVVLTHNRYTLLDRSAESLLYAAMERGMGVLNAAPYGGGMLVQGPEVRPRYAYGLGDESVVERAKAMMDACAAVGVPLAAAALQFSLREPRIHTTVVGMSAPERIRQTLELLDVAIPDALWARLRELTPSPQVWIG